MGPNDNNYNNGGTTPPVSDPAVSDPTAQEPMGYTPAEPSPVSGGSQAPVMGTEETPAEDNSGNTGSPMGGVPTA
jgi:hypothetical protein